MATFTNYIQIQRLVFSWAFFRQTVFLYGYQMTKNIIKLTTMYCKKSEGRLLTCKLLFAMLLATDIRL